MSDYRVATGHSIPLIDLTVLDPQPASRGIQVTARDHALNGAIRDQGPYIDLEWGVFETEADYRAMLTTFGILSILSENVTVYVLDETLTYVRRNGVVIRPRPGQTMRHEDFFIQNVVIRVVNLRVIA